MKDHHQALLDEVEELRLQLSQAKTNERYRDQRLHAISKGLHIGYWEWDELENKPVHFSEEMAEICGLDLDELYKRCDTIEGYQQLIHPQDRQYYKKHIGRGSAHFSAPGKTVSFDYRILLPDNGLRYVREQAFAIFDDDNKLIRSYGVLQDVSEYRQIVDALKLSEQRFFTLFDQLPVGIEEEDYRSIKKVVDKLKFKEIDDIQEYLQQNPRLLREMVAGTRITNVNQALLDMHLAESKHSFLVSENDLDDWWDAEWAEFYAAEIGTLASGKKYYEAERIDTRIDDSHFESRSITTIVKGHEDDWARVITIHEDISNRKRNEAELIEAKTLAEKANSAKSEFLSSMSHELRTPLNAILGFSQLFEYDQDISEQQRTNAAEINRAGRHLLVLIDEILDLARIEAGEVEISLEPVSLLDAVNDSLSWVENLLKNCEVSFHLDREQLENILVNADAVRLKQVFLNLFTNAIKYNIKGGSVFLIVENIQKGLIRFGVRDTGPGISENRLDDLFQPFNRLGAEFSDTEGTGIGLVITRQLIELMKGRLEVESIAGDGTTFWIELNLVDEREKEYIQEITESRVVRESQPDLKAPEPYILVAEDNAINRELMDAQMRFLGYQVNFATNGFEALEMWQSGKYYLLLTDIRMPVMNGYDLIREIRSIDITGSYPVSIIAITANAMDSDIEQCYEAGADDVISKPVEIEELRLALQKWVPKQAVENDQSDSGKSDTELSDTVIDQSVLQQSLGYQPANQQKLLNLFIDSMAEIVADIEDAHAWRNHEKISAAAHQLKSSARNMGALKLGDICQALETAAQQKNWSELESNMPLFLRQAGQASKTIQQFRDSNDFSSVKQSMDEYADDRLPLLEGNFNVLVVDDDVVMHRVTTTILNDLGIENIHSALSAPQALEMIEEFENGVDLVICDLNMPGMDGIEFMRHLARQHYSNSLILTSGEDIRILRTVEKLAIEHDLQVLGVIQKPVTPAKLNEMLESFGRITAEGTMILTDIVILEELKYALDHDEIDVFFQPKVDIKTCQAVGVEALVRWHHPKHGLVRPDAFITMAEENGLINQLTRSVCRMSLNYASQLKAKGIDLDIAINISVDALRDLEWPDLIAAQIEEAGLQPFNITFEITESRLMENISVALDILSRLSLKRFNLSIDDFGTGYSSMEQLQRIPFSELKIDRAFVNGASTDSSARAILESSILLAKNLDMKVVAEGVQNQQDWDLLESMQVDQVQGYFVARPLPFDQLINWLDDWQTQHPQN